MKNELEKMKQIEDEADYFARCLLMPAVLFNRFVDKNFSEFKGNKKEIEICAEKFGVPNRVAWYRLVELGHIPLL